MILVIDRKATTLRYKNATLLVERPGKDKQRIPINLLEQVIIHGNPLIEAGVWRALANRQVPSTILPTRGTQEPAILASGLAVRLPLRKMQHHAAANDQHSQQLAQWFIHQKADSYGLPLLLLPESHQQQVALFQQKIAQAHAKISATTDQNSLMGIEGALASRWFQLLGTLVAEPWGFKGRNRRPPQDPLNALLSLGYTLLGSEIYQVLITEGLDPSLGFLHQDQHGRSALMLDFIEPFRSGVDYFALQLLEQLSPGQFTTNAKDGCRLEKRARGMFYGYWAEQRESWPRISSLGEDNLRLAPLSEQIRGKVKDFRALFTQLIGVPSNDPA